MSTGLREPFAATLQVHHGEWKAFHMAVAITHRLKPGPLLGHPCAHASGLRQARKGSILPRPCTGAWLAQRDMDRPWECRGHRSFLSMHITQAQLEGLLLVLQTTDACQAGTQRPMSAAAGPSSLSVVLSTTEPSPSSFSPLCRLLTPQPPWQAEPPLRGWRLRQGRSPRRKAGRLQGLPAPCCPLWHQHGWRGPALSEGFS